MLIFSAIFKKNNNIITQEHVFLKTMAQMRDKVV